MSRHGRVELGRARLDSVRARETALDGKSFRIAGTPAVNEQEPISPELVLVDPELARRLNGGLPERAWALECGPCRRANESPRADAAAPRAYGGVAGDPWLARILTRG